MANIITGCRIMFSIFLLFFPAFSPLFYVCYISAVLTDMLDGFVAEHTVLNKATGLLMFLLPLTISFVDIEFGAAVVCAAATAAAVQEGYRIMKRKR